MAHKKYSDSAIAFTLANLPVGSHQLTAAARVLGCSHETIRNFKLRQDFPVRYPTRKPMPAPEIFEIALRLVGGNCAKAAKMLSIPNTTLYSYIVAERKKGRKIGNRRYVFAGNELERPIIVRKSDKVTPRGHDPLLDCLRQFALDLGIAA